MQAAVSDLVSNYVSLSNQGGDFNPSPLVSPAASLPLGGIFEDLDWEEPHCGHRNGQAIDLSSGKGGRPTERIGKSKIMIELIKTIILPFMPF